MGYHGPSDHEGRDPRVRPEISELEDLLREALGDTWLVRQWLTQPHPALGVSPIDLVNAGDLARVRTLAEQLSG